MSGLVRKKIELMESIQYSLLEIIDKEVSVKEHSILSDRTHNLILSVQILDSLIHSEINCQLKAGWQ